MAQRHRAVSMTIGVIVILAVAVFGVWIWPQLFSAQLATAHEAYEHHDWSRRPSY
jgi:hypothetical protein